MATARYLGISAEEMAEDEAPRGTGTYSEIEPGGAYEMTLVRVEDFISKKGDPGWKFTFQVETSTGPCDFRQWITVNPNMRQRLKVLFRSLGITSVETFEPDSIVGTVVGGTIDFPLDRATGQPQALRDIVAVFPLVQPPELEAPAAL